MKKFILSIDQGTTGTTALIINKDDFSLIAKHNEEFAQIFPNPGWVEHNLNDIWSTVEKCIKEVLKKSNIDKSDIYSIGITNQRETTCAYTKSGIPLANAIVWQDRRTSDYCKSKLESYSKFQPKTGLPLDPYFSGTKMNWLQSNNEDVKKAKEKNDLLFSTIDTFLLYKLTNCKSFKTEASNASRTLLMDLETCCWDDDLLSFFDINKSTLPSISDSFSNFGTTENLNFLPDGISISCMLGDQQAALFGQAGYNAGSLKCTYGTGAFILLNTGHKIKFSSNGLLTTVAFKHQGKPVYALEGAAYIAGAAVQWLRDNLEIVKDASEVENLALEVKDLSKIEHLIFFPFFTGIGSPYWNSEAKGAIVGLTRDTGKAEIARVCLEGMALSINDSINSLVKDSINTVSEIKVDGGACANNLLMQIQANISKKEIVRPKIIETTAYGVALGSLVGLNELAFEDIDKLWQKDKSFSPQESTYYDSKSNMWNDKVKKFFL
jgi:glycerol kinase